MCKFLPYAHHYKPQLVYFFTPFPKTIYVMWPLALCMACIQERLLIKSGLWWRAYGRCWKFQLSILKNKKALFLKKAIVTKYAKIDPEDGASCPNFQWRFWYDVKSFLHPHNCYGSMSGKDLIWFRNWLFSLILVMGWKGKLRYPYGS